MRMMRTLLGQDQHQKNQMNYKEGMTVEDLVKEANRMKDPLHRKPKTAVEEFVIDTAIKDHLNQLMIPFVTKLNQTMV